MSFIITGYPGTRTLSAYLWSGIALFLKPQTYTSSDFWATWPPERHDKNFIGTKLILGVIKAVIISSFSWCCRMNLESFYTVLNNDSISLTPRHSMSTFEEMKACSIIIDKHVSNCPYLYELVLEVLDLGRPLKFVDSAKQLVEKNFTALCTT